MGTLKFNRHEATDVLLQYDPPIEGFESAVAFFQSEPSILEGNVVFNINLDENGLFSIGECFVESLAGDN